MVDRQGTPVSSARLWLRSRRARPAHGDRFLWTVVAIGLVLLFMSAVGPFMLGGDPNEVNLSERLLAPSWVGGDGGPLGTDELGRPVLLRIFYGMRTSYFIGFG